ncbi:Diphthamide synthesis DPH1/DPH2 [Sesbania bispinosa]|nr:Diphthamide synthesis DPH1/DPH2 [Sesbania bispinosa]
MDRISSSFPVHRPINLTTLRALALALAQGQNVSLRAKSLIQSSTIPFLTPPYPFSLPTTTLKSTNASGASSPPEQSASPSNSPRASSCTLSPSPTSSPLSPASLTASSSATSPTVPVALTTSPPSLSAPISSFTTVTAVSYPSIPPPSLAFTIVLAGTIQFASAIRAAKPELEKHGFRVLIPQSKPLSAADGRFHLEAFMIANQGLRPSGRQGNPKILERLEKKMRDKGFDYTVVLMSEISPGRIALFEDSLDAWIQIACPRLSIDWGDAFAKPVLTPFEAEIALGLIPGWWEKTEMPKQGCGDGINCKKSDSCCKSSYGDAKGTADFGGDYPMDYYAQDGGEWNSSYVKGLLVLRGKILYLLALIVPCLKFA